MVAAIAKKSLVGLEGVWGLRSCFNSLITFFVAFVFVTFVSLSLERANLPESRLETCDPFSGRWVYDKSSRPLYSGLGCSFMNNEVACDKFGRKDTKYQGWRWQPHGCDLPKFDAAKLLQRLKGKRMVFVGDSLNRNQWMSMICLLESSIPIPHKSLKSNGSLLSFKAKEYNTSIDFYWSPLLVESNCDNPTNHRIVNRTMRADSIGKHAEQWRDADILVFNSYLWWTDHTIKMKVLYGSDDENENYKEVKSIEGFALALKAWSDWLELHLDTLKTQVFFVSLSPTHIRGDEWGGAPDRNCYNETELITVEGYSGRGTVYTIMRMVEDTVKSLGEKGVSVQILNITQLSEYRKDGHPSVYRKQWVPLTEEQLANPSSYADCNHWCLPGVPDVWNELLYTYIISR